jgi:hypothetical protein
MFPSRKGLAGMTHAEDDVCGANESIARTAKPTIMPSKPSLNAVNVMPGVKLIA